MRLSFSNFGIRETLAGNSWKHVSTQFHLCVYSSWYIRENFCFLKFKENPWWILLDLSFIHIIIWEHFFFPLYFSGFSIKNKPKKKTDAFELWCWSRLLRVPWTARRSNQFILKRSVLNVHWKDGCWTWNSNTLATWCKELIHLKIYWCWERLKAGGEGDSRGWDGWMASLTQWTWVWVTPVVGDGQGGLVCCDSWGRKESDTTEWLNWTIKYF